MMFDRGRVSARNCNQHRFPRARERARLSYRIPLSPDSISHLFHPEPACRNSDCTLTTLGWEKQLIFMKYKMFNPDQSGKDTKCKSFLWQIKCSRQLEPRPLRWYALLYIYVYIQQPNPIPARKKCFWEQPPDKKNKLHYKNLRTYSLKAHQELSSLWLKIHLFCPFFLSLTPFQILNGNTLCHRVLFYTFCFSSSFKYFFCPWLTLCHCVLFCSFC